MPALPTLREAPRFHVTWVASLLCLLALPLQRCESPPLHERAGFSAAVLHLEKNLGPNAVVVVWPPQFGETLSALPASIPATDTVPQEPAGARRFIHVWVIGPTGVPPPPEVRDAQAHPRLNFEDIDLLPFGYPNEPAIVFNLRDQLASATVNLVSQEESTSCSRPHPDGGWACPGQAEWTRVTPTQLTVQGQNWASVWAHPVRDRELRISMEVELGDTLTLEAALSDDAVNTQGGSPVRLELDVEGVGRRTLNRTNRRGVTHVSLPTPQKKTRVTLTITCPRPGRRHLGINLRATTRPRQP